jgi:hypothetical protein
MSPGLAPARRACLADGTLSRTGEAVRATLATLATYAASHQRLFDPCCMISSASQDSVSRLVADRFRTTGRHVVSYRPVANRDMITMIATCIRPWLATTRIYRRIQRVIFASSICGLCNSKYISRLVGSRMPSP